MKAVLQRVRQAHVSVDGLVVGKISHGLLILLGVHQNDTTEQAAFLAGKCTSLRIFGDDDEKMNLSLTQVNGSALVVSQFTLFADCAKGNRPSFIQAAQPDKGRQLYEFFVSQMKLSVPIVETGIFGANMEVSLVNDGPVTIILEK